MIKLAITMPVYNESEGIVNFIEEIDSSFGSDCTFFIVDDCSTDNTYNQIENLSKKTHFKNRIKLHRNEYNLGHGPTFSRAIRVSIDANPEFILTVDGDGQFIGAQLVAAFKFFLNSKLPYMETVRSSRQEALYRKIVSFVTRFLVYFKTRSNSKDANSPCRFYSLAFARNIWREIPERPIVPNIHVSILARRAKTEYAYFTVRSIPRRAANKIGTTWETSRVHLPSKKFVSFCLKALRYVIKI